MTIRTYCLNNVPESLEGMSDDEFDAMPKAAREKAVKDYEAWKSMCKHYLP